MDLSSRTCSLLLPIQIHPSLHRHYTYLFNRKEIAVEKVREQLSSLIISSQPYTTAIVHLLLLCKHFLPTTTNYTFPAGRVNTGKTRNLKRIYPKLAGKSCRAKRERKSQLSHSAVPSSGTNKREPRITNNSAGVLQHPLKVLPAIHLPADSLLSVSLTSSSTHSSREHTER